MKIDINGHEFSILWDGIYYKALSNYPNISDWEMKTLIDFINYNNEYNRDVQIESRNNHLLNNINEGLNNPKKFINSIKPTFITECTACKHNGCITNYLCHIASLSNAKKIFESGMLLSAAKARNDSINHLVQEDRNAAKDPADFFDYIMFSWGNCQAGDRLVMERELGRAPTEEDLSTGFTPGIRFYFKYNQLVRQPGSKHDGYHALKIKDKLLLNDNVSVIVIPEQHRKTLEEFIPNELSDKVIYIKNDCSNIWDWTEKVFNVVSSSKVR